MIEINELNKSYPIGQGSLHVLKGINLKINEGELVAIMGSSGSGKSTLLNIIGMLDNYDSGSYKLDNVPIKDLDETKAAKYRNKFLGFVFQSFNLINYKTALENIALPLYYQGISRAERQKTAIEYLEKVGLADWAEHLPSELSGGQKQRIAIARTLLSNPKLLILDEATSSLDTDAERHIQAAIERLMENRTTFVIAHRLSTVEKADTILVIENGQVVERGSHGELLNQAGRYADLYSNQFNAPESA